MIDRYSLPGMQKVWEQENKYSKWLAIEILACEALAELGEIPKEAVKVIKEKASFDSNRVNEIENEVKHDVIAFLTAVSENIGEEGKYMHKGLTSSDVLDTGLSLQLIDAANIILDDLTKLKGILKDKAILYKDTVMMGRSHGIHAEPITFGLKMALWYEDIKRNISRLERAKEAISYGKLSGAVGTFANISPYVEEYVCSKLGLTPDPVSTQIIQRDRHAEFMCALSLIAGTLEKFAVEIRHLQRTEVLEAEEPFTSGQKGSSAMPHKRNPVGSENITGLSRLIRSNSMAALENIALWHERDISHSSVERVILPDSTILLDYMLNRFINIIENLVVYPDNMLRNLNLTGGLIFSQRVLLELVGKTPDRDKAYRLVQRNAMESWKSGEDFQKLLMKDPDVNNFLNDEEIKKCFDISYHLKNVEYIFKRVFEN
ncbi:MAG: adenylosuccinate lyase [Nitrospirae bacterium]|nr:adenylosuccinate lyase [Nitrospirota bacterium]